MTTLPSNTPTTAAAATGPNARAKVTDRAAVEKVLLTWRVLRRAPEAATARGGEVRESRVEVELAASRITIRRLEGSAEVSASVLPARSSRRTTPTGDLLEWCCGDDGAGPECRVFVSPGQPPLVRTRLLDRLGVAGGTHDLESIHVDGLGPGDDVRATG